MSKSTILPGSQQDIDAIKALLDEANALVPEWSRSTLCHRLTRDAAFEQKLDEGRPSIQRLGRVKAELEAFIAERSSSAA